MQHLELSIIEDEQSIKAQIDSMMNRGLLREHQVREIDTGKVYTFFNSDLGRRMLEAKKVYREVPFNIELEYPEIFPGNNARICVDDKILLQGIIDCYFEEDDRFVLIDYKTDYVPDDDMGVVKERYKVQIEYYAKALEKITGRKVKEKYIYLFWNNHSIKF